MAKLDILNKNTIPKNIKNIDSNFTELYADTVMDVTVDGTSAKSGNTVALQTIQNSDIDSLFISELNVTNKLNGGALVGSHTYTAEGTTITNLSYSSDDFVDSGGYATLENNCITTSGATITVHTDFEAGYGADRGHSAVAHGTVNVVITGADGLSTTDSFTFKSDYTVMICYVKGTQILMADGTSKSVEDVQCDDELTVWNFDDGKQDTAKVFWITGELNAPYYWEITLSDGTILNLVGMNGKCHRLFNVEQGRFIYPQDFNNGEHTIKNDGTLVTIVSCNRIDTPVSYYNLQTEYHINNYANGVLTGCRFSNIYPIKDMKFVKDNRTLHSRDEFEEIPDKYFYGLRLSEQQEQDGVQYYSTIKDHVLNNYVRMDNGVI